MLQRIIRFSFFSLFVSFAAHSDPHSHLTRFPSYFTGYQPFVFCALTHPHAGFGSFAEHPPPFLNCVEEINEEGPVLTAFKESASSVLSLKDPTLPVSATAFLLSLTDKILGPVCAEQSRLDEELDEIERLFIEGDETSIEMETKFYDKSDRYSHLEKLKYSTIHYLHGVSDGLKYGDSLTETEETFFWAINHRATEICDELDLDFISVTSYD